MHTRQHYLSYKELEIASEMKARPTRLLSHQAPAPLGLRRLDPQLQPRAAHNASALVHTHHYATASMSPFLTPLITKIM